MKAFTSAFALMALLLLVASSSRGEAFHAPPSVRDLAVAPADVTIFGIEEHGNLGHSAVTGDVNGDGLDDIIVGARGVATPQPGTVYVIFGPANPPGRIIDAATEADVVIVGEAGGDFFGWSLTSGDFNGDQVDDFAVGAPRQPAGPGQIHVFLGPVASGTTIDLAVESSDLTVLGPDLGDELGWSLSSGDFNGDGLDDLLMGAHHGDGPGNSRTFAGEAHVVLGYAGMGDPAPQVRDLGIAGASDLTVFGADAADEFGESVTAGDFNGDGKDDLLLGADQADGPANDREGAGEAYVILGGSPLPSSPIDLAEGGADFVVYGASSFMTLGFSVGAGNLNGDTVGGERLDDIIIGAPERGNPTGTGEAFVILGSAGLGGSVDLASESADLRIVGVDELDYLGHLVAAGDFNGDSYDDLFVSARDAGDLVLAGEAYVIFGSGGLGVPDETIDLAVGGFDLRVDAARTWDRVGSGSSLEFGDLNGDGFDELMVMAPKADGPGTGSCPLVGIGDRCNAGELYVFFYPDADNDGIGDAVDSCQACVDDDDGDLVADIDETWCGGDPLNGNERPERVDGFFAGHDDDGDFSNDEALPLGADQYDCDGDGYAGAVEAYLYAGETDRDQDPCGVDGWPSDLNASLGPPNSVNRVNLLDVTSFLVPVRYFGTDVGSNPGDVRWDLVPGSGVFLEDINLIDIVALLAGTSGYPPMLGDTKAFGGSACPWAP